MDSYTETTSKSWFTRIKESIKGVVVGLLLFALSFPLLYWNEGRAVRQSNALKDGAATVVTISPDKVDRDREGFLVHLTGPATSEQTPVDPKFGVHAHDSLRLDRVVEMYQWQESKSEETDKKVGGGEETTITYSYDKVWSKKLIDSSRFHKPGYDNPSNFPYESRTFDANPAKVGVFHLGRLLGQLKDWKSFSVDKGEPREQPEELPVDEAEEPADEVSEPEELEEPQGDDPFTNRERLRAERKRKLERERREKERRRKQEEKRRKRERLKAERSNQRVAVEHSMRQSFLAQFEEVDGGYYLGDNPGEPQVGDARISFRVIPEGPVSLLAQQRGDGFAAYKAGNGNELYRITPGEHTAAEMFHQLEAENAQLTWILRGVGFMMMFFGLLTVFRPLAVMADVVPLFGSMLGAGIGVVSFFVAAPLTLLTIAVGWFAVRPVLGTLLAIAAGGLIFLGVKVGRKRGPAGAQNTPPS